MTDRPRFDLITQMTVLAIRRSSYLLGGLAVFLQGYGHEEAETSPTSYEIDSEVFLLPPHASDLFLAGAWCGIMAMVQSYLSSRQLAGGVDCKGPLDMHESSLLPRFGHLQELQVWTVLHFPPSCACFRRPQSSPLIVTGNMSS